MQFTCSTEKLIDALQLTTMAAANRTTNQILEGVLIEASPEQLVLTCTDERITIVTHLPAKVTEPGRGVVAAKLFTEIVRKLPQDEVSVRMDERYFFAIRSGASRMNLSGQDGDIFPALPQLQSEREISLPQSMLRDMIRKTQFAISPDDMREVLTGCLLEINGDEINMVALDGFRMALRRVHCANVLESASAIIPGRAVGDLGKLLSEDENAFAELSFDGNKLHIRLDNTEIFIILVEGKYIQYRQILPRDFTTRVEVDLDSFRDCVDRASIFARDGNNNLVTFKISDEAMVIEAHSQIGDVHEELDIVKGGADLNISFNVKYLNDVVRNIDAPRIEMNFNNAVSPCVITPVNDPDYLHLLLPVRTGAR